MAAQWATDIRGGAWGTLLVDTSWTLNFEDTIALFDETQEDVSGEAGHPDTVGSLNFTLDKDQWSFYWGMSFIGSTSNFASFGRTTVTDSLGVQVDIDLTADSRTYQNISASYDFENGLVARLGVANLLDEIPPRLTQRGTGNEVETLGNVAFYSQYDWLGRRIFANVTMSFD